MNLQAIIAGAMFGGMLQVAGADAMSPFIADSSSRVLIDAHNNIHDWQIKGERVDAILECGPDFPLTPAARLKPGTVRGEIRGSIPTQSLHLGARAKADVPMAEERVLYSLLNEKVHPRVLFRFSDLEFVKPAEAGAGFELDAISEIVAAGVTNRGLVAFTVIPLEDKVRILGSAKLKMTDFNIQPPEAKGENFTIKTRDEVTVSFDWSFRPQTKD
jgi:hypothetical protein